MRIDCPRDALLCNLLQRASRTWYAELISFIVTESCNRHVTQSLLLELFVFPDRVSLCIPGCLGTYYSVDQAGIELKRSFCFCLGAGVNVCVAAMATTTTQLLLELLVSLFSSKLVGVDND